MKQVEFYDAWSNERRTVTIQTNVCLIHDQGPLHETLKYLTLDSLEMHCALKRNQQNAKTTLRHLPRPWRVLRSYDVITITFSSILKSLRVKQHLRPYSWPDVIKSCLTLF